MQRAWDSTALGPAAVAELRKEHMARREPVPEKQQKLLDDMWERHFQQSKPETPAWARDVVRNSRRFHRTVLSIQPLDGSPLLFYAVCHRNGSPHKVDLMEVFVSRQRELSPELLRDRGTDLDLGALFYRHV